jgi:diguanylate cyclase (GGDEF)-like protein/PAS domain S-box-containing protein
MMEGALIGAAIITLLIIPFTRDMFRLFPIRVALTGGTLLVNGVCLILVRKRHLHSAGMVMTYGYWGLLAVLVATSGGIFSPWVIAQLTLIVVSGILFSGTAAVGLAVLTVLTDLAFYALQGTGRLALPEQAPVFADVFSAIVASFFLVALTMYLTRNLVQHSLSKARENEQRYRSLFDKTNDAVFLVDGNEVIISVNQRTADMLGYTIEEMDGLPYSQVVAADEKDSSNENFQRLQNQDVLPLFERTMVRKDGSRVTVEFSASVVHDGNGEVLYYQGVARNISERKLLEGQLKDSLVHMENVAMTDSLTGMMNRRAISERAELEWHRAQREGRPISMMVLDVDYFKEINDKFGHMVGDEALNRLGEAIRGAIRRSGDRSYDWAGRWGGDEFLLVLPGASLPASVEVAERMRVMVANTPIDLGEGKLVEMKVSVGVACYSGRPGDDLTLDRLLAQADQALYEAKQAGRNQVAVFRDSVD